MSNKVRILENNGVYSLHVTNNGKCLHTQALDVCERNFKEGVSYIRFKSEQELDDFIDQLDQFGRNDLVVGYHIDHLTDYCYINLSYLARMLEHE